MNSLICATIAFALLGGTDIPLDQKNAVQGRTDPFTVHSCEQSYEQLASASYHRGFRDGWAAGWRHVRGQFSMPPLAPLAPLPRPGEDHYRGGYNRGFEMGMQRARQR